MNKEAKQTDCAFCLLYFCILDGAISVTSRAIQVFQTLINLQFSLDFAMTSLPRIRCL